LTSLYLDFLDSQLIPVLNKKCLEYAEWWIFKPDSPLAKYILKNQFVLNLYFRPDELTSLLEDIASKDNKYDRGNYKIITLDDELKLCFNTDTIYVPDLYHLCIPHVYPVNDAQTFILKNNLIKNDIFIQPPLDIVYSDPSSQFWIPQEFVNPYVCENKQSVFTWKELNSKFLQFISSPEDSSVRRENSMFFINDDSIFAKKFNFQQFHKNQIPDILKKTVRFLGKSNTILTLCPDLKFSHIRPHDPVVYWIEEIIMQYNHLTPYVPANIYL
jgi:hypothetical protein